MRYYYKDHFGIVHGTNAPPIFKAPRYIPQKKIIGHYGKYNIYPPFPQKYQLGDLGKYVDRGTDYDLGVKCCGVYKNPSETKFNNYFGGDRGLWIWGRHPDDGEWLKVAYKIRVIPGAGIMPQIVWDYYYVGYFFCPYDESAPFFRAKDKATLRTHLEREHKEEHGYFCAADGEWYFPGVFPEDIDAVSTCKAQTFQCPFCTFSAFTKADIKTHMLTMHKPIIEQNSPKFQEMIADFGEANVKYILAWIDDIAPETPSGFEYKGVDEYPEDMYKLYVYSRKLGYGECPSGESWCAKIQICVPTAQWTQERCGAPTGNGDGDGDAGGFQFGNIMPLVAVLGIGTIVGLAMMFKKK